MGVGWGASVALLMEGLLHFHPCLPYFTHLLWGLMMAAKPQQEEEEEEEEEEAISALLRPVG